MSDEAEARGEQDTLDIRSAQGLAWGNKVRQGFNTTDVPLEFCLLQGEMAEAFDAWRKGQPDVAQELADVAIYLLSLAEMLGIDLQDAVGAKLASTRPGGIGHCRTAHSSRAQRPPNLTTLGEPRARPGPSGGGEG